MKIPFFYGREFMTRERNGRSNKLSKCRSRGGVLPFAKVRHNLIYISTVILVNTYTFSLFPSLS